MRAMKSLMFCSFVALTSFGCDELTQRPKEQPRTDQASSVPAQQAVAPSTAMRFVFPAQSSPFPESSVALDTTNGRLCKTYAWEDNSHLPKGLPLCSELTAPQVSNLVGSKKAYMGFTYTFNGTTWVKGNKFQNYNEKTHALEPWSEDQYDPLNLFSKEEKAKRTLTAEQIRRVAEQFGVSYQEAMEEAKQQGYQVTARPPLSSFEKP